MVGDNNSTLGRRLSDVFGELGAIMSDPVKKEEYLISRAEKNHAVMRY